MRRALFRSSWMLVGVAFLVLATAFFLAGCSDDPESITSPAQSTYQEGSLSKLAQDVERVMVIQDRHTDRLLKLGGVIGTGTTIGADGKPAIKVYTKDADQRELIPDMLDGIPVIVDPVGEIRAMSFTSRYGRPVPIGVSVGNMNECSAGTIGCAVQKSGKRYVLSNNHVLARINKASIGEKIVQPGSYDVSCAKNNLDEIGTLSEYRKIQFGFFRTNVIDAAIALSSSSNLGSSTPSGSYGTPSSMTMTAAFGMAVQKCGRTTQTTHGSVSAVNVTIYVDYGGKIGRFVKQIEVSSTNAFIQPGDSGSLLVTEATPFNPVGLLFAGNSSGTRAYANPINDVLSAFGVTISTN